MCYLMPKLNRSIEVATNFFNTEMGNHSNNKCFKQPNVRYITEFNIQL